VRRLLLILLACVAATTASAALPSVDNFGNGQPDQLAVLPEPITNALIVAGFATIVGLVMFLRRKIG
jgi:hypothetical protein